MKIIYQADNSQGYALLCLHDDHKQVVDVPEHEATAVVDATIDTPEIIPATYRKETDAEMIKRLLNKPWIYQPAPLPERFEIDWTKNPPVLSELPALPIIITDEMIKAECSSRINAQVSANTRENLTAEMGRLQFEMPTGWEIDAAKIMEILAWIRATIAASRAMVIAKDPDYLLDTKWPPFPSALQALVDAL